MAQQSEGKQMPIGYWLKRLDQLLTERSDGVLRENDFTRTRWQVLNSLYEAATTMEQRIFALMKTFVTADQLRQILGGFEEEGWITRHEQGEDAELEMTETGKQKRDAIFKLQNEVRHQATLGISNEEYTMAVDVLERMAKNLE